MCATKFNQLTALGIGRAKKSCDLSSTNLPSGRTVALSRRFPRRCNIGSRINRLLKGGLLNVRQKLIVNAKALILNALTKSALGRKMIIDVVEVVNSQTELFNVVRTLHTAGSLTSRLNCRKEKPDQNTDDRDNDQQFDKSETAFRHF